jgi:thioester reductase-like protein
MLALQRADPAPGGPVSRVLVTGGTGVLGSRVVARLDARGQEVKILSRREHTQQSERVEVVRGELRSSKGLTQAVSGVDAIVHCASGPLWRARATEVGGLGNLIEATGGKQPHLLYISIVGVDRIPYYYYYYYYYYPSKVGGGAACGRRATCRGRSCARRSSTI